ncbi:MAG TPA: hypothetical protein GXX36_13755 [Clostridiaceae bacterium]|nr:hypothetical protein [Clostridiaceae bacterium]
MISKPKSKFKRLIPAMIIILIIIFTYIFLFTEVGRRFAIYHNYVDLVVRIDSIQCNMEGIKVDYIYETDDVLETSFFDNYSNNIAYKRRNRVKFRKGTYGGNIFKFVIPKLYLKDFARDIEISFGHFNTNWWHINKYVIDVEITQISSESANVTLTQKISWVTDGLKKDSFEKTISKKITENDTSVSIYTGP